MEHAGRLRLKESDRLEATCRLLQDLGGSIRLEGDCLVIQGGTPLPPAARWRASVTIALPWPPLWRPVSARDRYGSPVRRLSQNLTPGSGRITGAWGGIWEETP